MFHAIVSIKNDGHYFPGTGARCTDGLNVTLTLRRQYHENVLYKLQLIALGQAAGFSLDEIAAMFVTEGKIDIDRDQLQQRAKEIDITIRRLQLLSLGLKHVAHCTQPEHTHCEKFKRIVSRGLRLVR